MKLLLTGASGFVGSALLRELQQRGRDVRPVFRRVDSMRRFGEGIADIAVVKPVLALDTDWAMELAGVEIVVHVAARVHVLRETSADPLAEFRRVNVDGTLNLARQAVAAGVRRFVFVSTVGVHGSITDTLFTEDSPARPNGDYALSKWEAEQGLREIALTTGLEVVIVRPPLVYGAGASGNFDTLSRWLGAHRPLPFGCITSNQRSYIAIDNLVSFLVLCTEHPAAAGQRFLISDGDDVSTRVFVERIAHAQGLSPRLLPVPAAWMRFVARLLGKLEVADRLLGNLQVDISRARDLLDWRPVVTMEEQLAKMFISMRGRQ